MPDWKNLGAVAFAPGDKFYMERGTGPSAAPHQVVLGTFAVLNVPTATGETADGDKSLVVRSGAVIMVDSAPGGGGYATLEELGEDLIEAFADNVVGPATATGMVARIITALAELEDEFRLNGTAIAPPPGEVWFTVTGEHSLAVGDQVAYEVDFINADRIRVKPILDQLGQLLWPVSLLVLTEAPNPADPPVTEVYTAHQFRRAMSNWQHGENELVVSAPFAVDADLGPNFVIALEDDAEMDDIENSTDDGGGFVVYQKTDANSPALFDHAITFNATNFEVLNDITLNTGENAITTFVWGWRPALNGGTIPAKKQVAKVG